VRKILQIGQTTLLRRSEKVQHEAFQLKVVDRLQLDCKTKRSF